ncbi:MAG: hypothetical protein OEV00_14175 [Acidobacteriota bacterium]|nr:hypothetical protein [Acidobacteriota bacterium]MDH3786457.1 hypothetical protein [Acidobacteriota bacterium]
MAFTARIFGVLEEELDRHLLSGFELVRHHTRTGATTLQPQDEATVAVWIRNDSGITLRGVRGEIVAGPGVRFNRQRFSVGRLRSHLEVRVVEFQIHVVETESSLLLVDRIGVVHLEASADLSEFRFRSGPNPVVGAAHKKHSRTPPVFRYIASEPPEPRRPRGSESDDRVQPWEPADADS